MKVLMLNGSPRAKGNTALALAEMEKIFHAEGIETELIQVGQRDIRGCIACGRCKETGRCVFDDVVNELAPKLQACDGLVVGSPVYYAAANATLVALLSRLFYSTPFDKTMKVGAAEVAARRGGFIMSSPGEHPLMGVVLEGEVEMISEDSFGKKSLLSVLPVGSIFGESYTCIKAKNRTIAYQARTASRVLLLDYGRILHACKLVCRFHHRMIENMVELIAEKNVALVEKLEVTSRTTIREKLLTYLARQAEAAGSRTFTVPMSRTALAEYLCADRSAMTRELAHMKAEGLIDYDKRQFTLYS